MESQLQRKTLNNGINVYFKPTKQFKTNIIKVFIHQQLNEENVTKTALLPNVLKRGTKRMPTTKEIKIYLEELYGAGLAVDVFKKGERHVIMFELEFINERFLYKEENLFEKGLETLKEVVFSPLLEKGEFRNDYFIQESNNLVRDIESLFNNKMQYSIEKCIQKMCEGENYSLYRYGRIQDFHDLANKDLLEYYYKIISSNPIDIFFMGDIEIEDKIKTIEKVFDFPRKDGLRITDTSIGKEVNEEKLVFDKQNVSQGKLSIGIRTYTTFKDKDYYALLVANGILGGGPHSKLFQNVREKESLAYYAFSRIENIKGIMIISSGIEVDNYKKTLKIIKKQIDDIKKDNITDVEIDSTKKMLINSLKEMSDNPRATINFHLDCVINKKEETIEEMINKIENVKKDEIIKVANKLIIDTIYFLSNKEVQ